jgi:hypothetical protein
MTLKPMQTHHPDNERIKRRSLIPPGGERVPRNLARRRRQGPERFETYSRYCDFKAFHLEQATGFNWRICPASSRKGRVGGRHIGNRAANTCVDYHKAVNSALQSTLIPDASNAELNTLHVTATSESDLTC